MALKAVQSQKQTLSINTKFIQAVEILQMTGQQLNDYVADVSLENCAADIDLLYTQGSPVNVVENNEVPFCGNKTTSEDRNYFFEPATSSGYFDTLESFLRIQLSKFTLSEEQEAIAHYLIKCIDSRGYLNEDIFDTAKHLGVTPEKVNECLSLLRSLEPKGVCAADLTQCLLLQLDDGQYRELCEIIIKSHLEALASTEYSAIAEKTNHSLEDVEAASSIIRALSPLPALGFQNDDSIHYVSPDVSIYYSDGKLNVSVYRAISPYLQVSSEYQQMYENCNDLNVREYLYKDISAFESIIKYVNQRESTLLSCARIIAEVQADFFMHSDGELVSLSLSDIADRIGVHVSTVSRAISGKYILCSRGVIPMKSFLVRRISKEINGTPEDIKRMIQAIIAAEDRNRPLTDKQICMLLNNNSIIISRRTVAKYREQLNIPGASVRKCL